MFLFLLSHRDLRLSVVSFNMLIVKYCSGWGAFADNVNSELLSLTLVDMLECSCRKLDRRQKIKRILRRAMRLFSLGGST